MTAGESRWGPRARAKMILAAVLVLACGEDGETYQRPSPRGAIPREVEAEPLGEDGPTVSDEELPGVVRLLGLTRAIVTTRVTESSSAGNWVSYEEGFELFFREGVAHRVRIDCALRTGDVSDLQRLGIRLEGAESLRTARSASVVNGLNDYAVEYRNRTCTVSRKRSR